MIKVNKNVTNSVDTIRDKCYNSKCNRGKAYKKGVKMDKLVQDIKKARRVITALIQLTLEIGTLLAIIKMVIQNL